MGETAAVPLKAITEVYPELVDKQDGYWWGASSYQPMLESLGFEIALQIDDDDYQGDSRLLLRDGEKVGYLNFGWGSCSGCDALQACDSIKEVENLRQSLFDSIRWFDGPRDALKFFVEHDWEGDYSWYDEEQKQFVAAAVELLAVA